MPAPSCRVQRSSLALIELECTCHYNTHQFPMCSRSVAVALLSLLPPKHAHGGPLAQQAASTTAALHLDCDVCDRSRWTDHRRVKSQRFSCGKGVPAGALAPGAVEGQGGCMCQADKCDDAAACCAACRTYRDAGTFGGCDAW